MSSNTFPSSGGTKPKFDPNKPYEAVKETAAQKKPKFDPNKPFEEITKGETTKSLPKIDFNQPFMGMVTTVSGRPTVTAGEIIENSTLKKRAQQSLNTLVSELESPDNDAARERLLKELKYQDYQKQIPIATSDMGLNPAQETARRLIPELANPKAQDFPVTPEELLQEKEANLNDESSGRRLIKHLAKENPDKGKTLQKALYEVDKFRTLTDDPQSIKRIDKILENSKKIEEGKLKYDPESGQLYEEQGFIKSALSGWRQKSKANNDFDLITFGRKEDVINEFEQRRRDYDPDKPLEVPEGKGAELAQMAGATPIMPILAGVVPSLIPGTQALAVPLSAAVGSEAYFRLGKAQAFDRHYNELRDKGVPESEAYDEAISFANKSAAVDAANAAVMSAVGSRIGIRSMPKGALTEGFRNATVEFLKKSGAELGKDVAEGLAGGATGGVSEGVKNWLAQQAGSSRQIDEGVAAAMVDNLLFTGAIAAASKGGQLISRAKYKSILNGLKNVSEAEIDGNIAELLERGTITEQEAQKAKDEIKSYKEVDDRIPENISEDARLKIQDKIKRRDELEAQLEKTDKSFHPEIKEKIKAIEEEINSLAQDKVKAPKENKKVLDVIDKAVEDGKLSDMMATMAKAEPDEFMKMVADQAHGRLSSGEMSDIGNAEYAVRSQFGDEIVDLAKEMFPVEEPKQSLISVIRPEQNKNVGETITIKPKEDALPIESPDEVPLGETPRDSEQMVEGIPQSEEFARTQEESQGTRQEEVVPITPRKGVFVEYPETELSHRGLQNVANEFSLPDVQKRTRKTDIQLRKEAIDQIKAWDQEGTYPQNIERLTQKAEEGEVLTDTERVIMEQNLANLTNELRQMNPTTSEYNTGLLQLKRLKEAGEKTRSEAGAALRLPTFRSRPIESLPDALVAKMEAAGVDELTDNQKLEVKGQVDKYKSASDRAEKATADLESKVNEAKADTEIKKTRRRSGSKKRKTAEQFKAERTAAIEAAREALKKLRTGESGLSAVPLPGVRELAAIAPHVKDLMVSLVEQGVYKLEDVVKALHEDFKDVLEGITEKNIQDIIAGVYNKEKAPLSDLQKQLQDLQLEARLINDLAMWENGPIPKIEKQQRERNQNIKELRDQLRALKKEYANAEKQPVDKTERSLINIKKRNEARQNEILEKIKKGDFSGPEEKYSILNDPEVKKKYPQLRKEALDAIAAKEEAKHEFELALFKDEQAKRSTAKKLADTVGDILHTSKAIMSGIDDSATFVQNWWTILTNPKEGIPAWIDHWKDAFNPARMKREIAAMHSDPAWDVIEKSGVDIIEPQSQGREKVEEAFERNILARWKPKIGDKVYEPWKHTGGIFERAFTSLGNGLRFRMFKERMADLLAENKTFETHPEEYKAAARAVNETTGRGKLAQPVEQISSYVTPIIWAPKMIASSLNQLGVSDLAAAVVGRKGYYRQLTPKQRTYAIKQMGKGISLGILAMAAASYGGGEVDFDPRSVTFGNVKFGHQSYNVFGRFSPYAKMLVQFAMGERIKPGGKVQDLDSGKFGAKTRAGVVGGVLRSKLTPMAGAMFDLTQGRNYFTNEPFGLSDLPKALLMPLSIRELREGWERDGAWSLLTRFLPSFEGIKVTDDRDFEKKKSTKTKTNKKKPTKSE